MSFVLFFQSLRKLISRTQIFSKQYVVKTCYQLHYLSLTLRPQRNKTFYVRNFLHFPNLCANQKGKLPNHLNQNESRNSYRSMIFVSLVSKNLVTIFVKSFYAKYFSTQTLSRGEMIFTQLLKKPENALT